MTLTTRPSFLRRAAVVGVCVGGVLSGCSDSSGTDTTSPTTTVAVTTTGPESPPTTLTDGTSSTTTTSIGGPVPPPDGAVMQLTFQLSPDIRWADGEQVSVADIACTVDALASTPGSADAAMYASVIEVRAGRAEDSVEVFFDRVVAGYRSLLDRLVQASSVGDCSDVSGEWADEVPPSAGTLRIEVWNRVQMILVPADADDADELGFDRVVLVPLRDIDLEVDVLRSGEVDVIAPDIAVGVADRLTDPNLVFELQASGRHEDLYLRSGGVFDDEVFRSAFWQSVDRQRLVEEVYEPIRTGAAIWDCGPTTVEDWCGDAFSGSFDPGAGAQTLTEAGWTFSPDGLWQDPTGEPAVVRWLVDVGHGRQRQLVDAFVPMMESQGFDLEIVECGGSCVFSEAVVAGGWDVTIFASDGLGDVGMFERRFACGGTWNVAQLCDAEVDALIDVASGTLDPDEQAAAIGDALVRMVDLRQVLPLVRLPSALAWRPDKVGPDTVLRDVRAAGVWTMGAIAELEDLDGDGQIVIGVESWPSCVNPVLECGGSGWYRRTIGAFAIPGVWESADGRGLVFSPVVRREPFATVLSR
ncbi:MAG: ABC transporter substrate-binding protein [Ilumatobacteraceae bacterium]